MKIFELKLSLDKIYLYMKNINRSKVNVQQPKLMAKYNAGMGGVENLEERNGGGLYFYDKCMETI